MFSRIRRRITFANVAMTLALVFAMSGGAYAAGKYLINSTKQINPKVLKALKGKTGAAGKEGLAGKEGAAGKEGPKGANGTNGTEGPKGANGTNGSNGESVTASGFSGAVGTCTVGGSEFNVGATTTFACNGKAGATGAPGGKGADGASVTSAPEQKGANCEEGGSSFTVGAKTTYACNGSPWTAGGTLPSGQSETGQWATDFTTANAFVAISFPIPLKSAATGAVFVPVGETRAHCKGSVEKPEADAGYLCVFGQAPANTKAAPPYAEERAIVDAGSEATEAGPTGATMLLGAGWKAPEAPEEEEWIGTWAVTAA